MPSLFKHRAKLLLPEKEKLELRKISKSQKKSAAQVFRANVLLAYNEGKKISEIVVQLGTNRPKIERCIDKALNMGAMNALFDLRRKGAPAKIGDDAKAWVVSLACRKPKEPGYSYELWTTALLASHARKECDKKGFPSLKKLGKGTVSKILNANDIHPHRIKYYLEKRDPEFEQKMAEVLCVYQEIHFIRTGKKEGSSLIAYLSYDEKPGIQAIENTAPDLSPVPGKYSTFARDYEYVRHGTVSLMAAIDLMDGKVFSTITNRHRSKEFIEHLEMLDRHYAKDMKIKIIPDNHSAHISKETQAYLKTKPNRFEFVFTPKHGSWLNMIEMFFSKLARTMLRGIRVSSKDELIERLKLYIEEINESPVIFRWKHAMKNEIA